MGFVKHIYWLKDIDRASGLVFFILCYRGSETGGHDLEAWITPSQGSNLCRFSVDGKNVIDFQRDLLKVDFTGTPVLYPTPNRVRDGVIHYSGKAYPQVKRRNTVLEHGLVHNEEWNYQEPQVLNDSVNLRTWFDFEPSNPVFEAFPFSHRLYLDFCLSRIGIQVSYTIENHGSEPIPFGFGLHPYFNKLDDEDHTSVQLPATKVMETTPDLLPTGRLMDVSGTDFDLIAPVPIGALNMDHVYTGVAEGQSAQIHYGLTHLRVRLTATPDFSHLVIYSPVGEKFFCLENQTCSTDAHNMFAHGFRSESGLKFVNPGTTHTGSVTYEIHKE